MHAHTTSTPPSRDGWPLDTTTDPTLPLSGVRVLDLSRVLAGPLAATVLGDLGADVIKVESPHGDETRRWGPPFHGDDAAYYLAVNRNRRSVVLDLRGPEGADRVRRLVGACDVVIENFLPGQLARLGLDDLRDASPHAVWVSVRGAAAGGPLADLPGYDAMAQGRSGLMSVTGHPESGPVKVGVPVVDVVTGLYAAIGALGALVGVRDGHDAARVEVPLFECGVATLVNQAANHLVGGLVPALLGNGHPNVVPYGPMPTADGQIIVGATGERQFAALCAAVGFEHLPLDARFATNADRLRHREELHALLADVFTGASTREWRGRLESAGVPCAPVNRVDEVFAEPQISTGDLVRRIEHPAGWVDVVTSPITLNGRRPPVRRVPPLLGEHTDELGEPDGPDS